MKLCKVKDNDYQKVYIIDDDDSNGIVIHIGNYGVFSADDTEMTWLHITLDKEQSILLNNYLENFLKRK